MTEEGTLFGGRYQIIRQLGRGGFGVTFLAKDIHYPKEPTCVLKQLNPDSEDPSLMKIAERLFNSEAEVLAQLGDFPQIPRLLAYFSEDGKFYLVQQLVEGHDLTSEIKLGQRWTEAQLVIFLQEILTVLSLVHQKGVIHRDIKPANLMRQVSDKQLYLIDFGAVKQVIVDTFDLANNSTHIQSSSRTIGIGTEGYMPSEQANGKPKFSSDVYAVGIIAIQALTGKYPLQLHDTDTEEIIWRDEIEINPELAKILDKMVRYDFRGRYDSAVTALNAINCFSKPSNSSILSSTPESTFILKKPKKSIKIIMAVVLFLTLGLLGISLSNSNFSIFEDKNAIPEKQTPAF